MEKILNKVKKYYYLAILFPSVAFAQTGDSYSGPKDVQGVIQLFKDAVTYLYEAFYIVAVGFILWAAFNYLQGGNNPEKIKAAKGQLKYAIIAIVIALVASGVTTILNSFISSK